MGRMTPSPLAPLFLGQGRAGRQLLREGQVRFGEFGRVQRLDVLLLREFLYRLDKHLRLFQVVMPGKRKERRVFLDGKFGMNAVGLGSGSAHSLSVHDGNGTGQFGYGSSLHLVRTLWYTEYGIVRTLQGYYTAMGGECYR